MQQGRHAARVILADLVGKERKPFRYLDKGNVATIGRSRAVVEMGKLRFRGFVAWLLWLLVHIYYLSGFQNRLLVLIQWAWSYVTFGRGARLIVDPEEADRSRPQTAISTGGPNEPGRREASATSAPPRIQSRSLDRATTLVSSLCDRAQVRPGAAGRDGFADEARPLV